MLLSLCNVITSNKWKHIISLWWVLGDSVQVTRLVLVGRAGPHRRPALQLQRWGHSAGDERSVTSLTRKGHIAGSKQRFWPGYGCGFGTGINCRCWIRKFPSGFKFSHFQNIMVPICFINLDCRRNFYRIVIICYRIYILHVLCCRLLKILNW